MTFYLQEGASLVKKASVTAEEARSIWLSAKQKHTELLIKTLWFTGLRISEATSIMAGDLLPNGYEYLLNITRLKQVRKKKRKHIEVAPAVIERLPIPRELGLDLKEFIKTNSIAVTQRLFPAHRATYYRQIQRSAKEAGIARWQDIHCHSFRHGFIYYKASQGVHPYVLSKLSGHRNLRTTMEYYEPTEDDLRQAMEK